MKRLLARWMISRSLDLGKPIPQRVIRWIERDPQLRAFQAMSHRLDVQLRRECQSASRWDDHVESSGTAPARIRCVATWYCGWRLVPLTAIAAGIALYVVGVILPVDQPVQHVQVARSQTTDLHDQVVMTEMEDAMRAALLETKIASRALFIRCSRQAQRISQDLGSLREIPDFSGVPIAKSSGIVLGRAWCNMEEELSLNHRALSAAASQAIKYCAHQLRRPVALLQ